MCRKDKSKKVLQLFSRFRIIIWSVTIVTTLNHPSLSFQKLPKIWIAQGNYDFEIKLSLSSIKEELDFLETTVQKYNNTCTEVSKYTTKLKCFEVTRNQMDSFTKLNSMHNLIKSFFVKTVEKRSWRFWTWMTDDDRTRVDLNTDKLRQNDEKLKYDIEHQSIALDRMYDFINITSVQADNVSQQIMQNFENLRQEIKNNLKFTFDVKKVLYLQSILLEIVYWMEELISSIKNKQNIFINTLFYEKLNAQHLIQLLGETFFETELYRIKDSLPKYLTFPTLENNKIDPMIWKAITLYYEINNNKELLIFVKIPLIQDKTFYAIKAISNPGFNNTIVSIIDLENDIIIIQNNSNWGYITKSLSVDSCTQLYNSKLCYTNDILKNLSNSNNCLAEAMLQQSYNNCKVRHVKLNEELWFATTNRNIWRYVTLGTSKIRIINHTEIMEKNITESGLIEVGPNMIIETFNIRIEYYFEMNLPLKISEEMDKIIVDKIEIEDWMIEYIPIFNSTTKKIDIIDHKKLYDIGIDLTTIKKHKTVLENLEYAPYNYPWWFLSGSILIPLTVIFMFIACFRGKISCFTKRIIYKPNLNKDFSADEFAKKRKYINTSFIKSKKNKNLHKMQENETTGQEIKEFPKISIIDEKSISSKKIGPSTKTTMKTHRVFF